MLCPKCQFENPEGIKFCGECGAKLETLCPSCNSSNPPNFKFCGECGHNLVEVPKETTPIKYSEPQSYTPKFLADKILTTRSSIEGERKLVSVLFADVANYTSMSEKLDPEEVHQIMDGCFKILMDEIHHYEGTINQFTGDGVMALFGAPVAHEDHAQRACRAALAIQKAMNEYGQKIERNCDIEFMLRIGLNSGPVIVGAIGDDLRMDYTAVGDTTNLANRMESMAEPGAVQISENTYRLIKAYFDCEDLGPAPVKGKEEPQGMYKLIKPSEVQTRIEASVSRGLIRFVGRKNSMAAIQNAWDKTVSGSGQVLGVVGEAGVGKSRLLLEFRNSLTNSDFSYFEGRCIHYGGSIAYLPILDIVKAFFEIEEGQSEYLINKNINEKLMTLDAERLSDSRPVFQELLSLKVENESWLKLEPKTRRDRTFESLKNLFIRLSEEKPLIIAIEDLHWMDKTSEEFLGYFIDSMVNNSILLIILYRPEYTHKWGSKSNYNKIGLDQLTMESSGELVSAILEGGEVATELKELILNRSAGNPLFMEEFTHTLLENGSIERRDEQFVLSKKSDDIRVPDTIQGIIASRLDRLEDNLKRTMQVASVIGRDFAFRILQTITGMREELKSYLLNLQSLEFIYEKSLFPELEYIFKHALTQEVAYNSLLNKKRKEIHEKIGQAIEQIYAERLEEFYEILAYHYSKGEDIERAYQYLKLSGEKATKSHSNREAFHYYKEAFQILRKMPKTEKNQKEQLEIIYLISGPMMIVGYPEDSLAILKEGEGLSKELGDEKGLVIFHSRMGRYYGLIARNPLLGIEYSEKSFQEAENIGNVELVVRTGYDLCPSYAVAGQMSKINDLAPKIIVLLEESKKEHESFGPGLNAYSGIHGYYAVSKGWLGYFQDGEVLVKKALRFSAKINDTPSMAWLQFICGHLLVVKGDGIRAIKHLQNSISQLEETKFYSALGQAWTFLGWGYYLINELDTARKHIGKGLKIQKETEIGWWLPLPYWLLSLIHLDLGDLKHAMDNVEKALKLSQKNYEIIMEGLSWAGLGRVLSTNDRLDKKAKEFILKGIQILDELKLRPACSIGHFFLGELEAEANQHEVALKSLKNAEKMFQEMKMDYWLKRTQDILKSI